MAKAKRISRVRTLTLSLLQMIICVPSHVRLREVTVRWVRHTYVTEYYFLGYNVM
jgi:hypothetical protein